MLDSLPSADLIRPVGGGDLASRLEVESHLAWQDKGFPHADSIRVKAAEGATPAPIAPPKPKKPPAPKQPAKPAQQAVPKAPEQAQPAKPAQSAKPPAAKPPEPAAAGRERPKPPAVSGGSIRERERVKPPVVERQEQAPIPAEELVPTEKGPVTPERPKQGRETPPEPTRQEPPPEQEESREDSGSEWTTGHDERHPPESEQEEDVVDLGSEDVVDLDAASEQPEGSEEDVLDVEEASEEPSSDFVRAGQEESESPLDVEEIESKLPAGKEEQRKQKAQREALGLLEEEGVELTDPEAVDLIADNFGVRAEEAKDILANLRQETGIAHERERKNAEQNAQAREMLDKAGLKPDQVSREMLGLIANQLGVSQEEAVKILQNIAKSSSPAEVKKALSTSKIAAKKRMKGSGVNGSYLVTTEEGDRGVWKPSHEEAEGFRRGVNAGTYYQREVAASEVADILGFGDLVPPTTMREYEGGSGSVQEFKPNTDSAAAHYGRDSAFDGPEDAARAAVFDYLVGHSDRHYGNWLVEKGSGKPVLIDNGLAFPFKYDSGDFPSNGFSFLKHAVDNRYKIPDLSGIADKWPEVEVALKKMGLETGAILRTAKRFEDLLKMQGKEIGDLPSLQSKGKNVRGFINRLRGKQEDLGESPKFRDQVQKAVVELGLAREGEKIGDLGGADVMEIAAHLGDVSMGAVRKAVAEIDKARKKGKR